MSRRALLRWPDKRLRTPAAPVGKITDEVHQIWTEMVAIMDEMPGYGLAAPQIGVMQRLAVVDCSTERGRAILLADPEIISTDPKMRPHEEASPNLPGVSAKLERSAKVMVSFTDHHGMRVRHEFEGLWATSVQHQIDHLNGRMFFDNLSRTKRAILLKKAAKGQR